MDQICASRGGLSHDEDLSKVLQSSSQGVSAETLRLALTLAQVMKDRSTEDCQALLQSMLTVDRHPYADASAPIGTPSAGSSRQPSYEIAETDASNAEVSAAGASSKESGTSSGTKQTETDGVEIEPAPEETLSLDQPNKCLVEKLSEPDFSANITIVVNEPDSSVEKAAGETGSFSSGDSFMTPPSGEHSSEIELSDPDNAATVDEAEERRSCSSDGEPPSPLGKDSSETLTSEPEDATAEDAQDSGSSSLSDDESPSTPLSGKHLSVSELTEPDVAATVEEADDRGGSSSDEDTSSAPSSLNHSGEHSSESELSEPEEATVEEADKRGNSSSNEEPKELPSTTTPGKDSSGSDVLEPEVVVHNVQEQLSSSENFEDKSEEEVATGVGGSIEKKEDVLWSLSGASCQVSNANDGGTNVPEAQQKRPLASVTTASVKSTEVPPPEKEAVAQSSTDLTYVSSPKELAKAEQELSSTERAKSSPVKQELASAKIAASSASPVKQELTLTQRAAATADAPFSGCSYFPCAEEEMLNSTEKPGVLEAPHHKLDDTVPPSGSGQSSSRSPVYYQPQLGMQKGQPVLVLQPVTPNQIRLNSTGILQPPQSRENQWFGKLDVPLIVPLGSPTTGTELSTPIIKREKETQVERVGKEIPANSLVINGSLIAADSLFDESNKNQSSYSSTTATETNSDERPAIVLVDSWTDADSASSTGVAIMDRSHSPEMVCRTYDQYISRQPEECPPLRVKFTRKTAPPGSMVGSGFEATNPFATDMIPPVLPQEPIDSSKARPTRRASSNPFESDIFPPDEDTPSRADFSTIPKCMRASQDPKCRTDEASVFKKLSSSNASVTNASLEHEAQAKVIETRTEGAIAGIATAISAGKGQVLSTPQPIVTPSGASSTQMDPGMGHALQSTVPETHAEGASRASSTQMAPGMGHALQFTVLETHAEGASTSMPPAVSGGNDQVFSTSQPCATPSQAGAFSRAQAAPDIRRAQHVSGAVNSDPHSVTTATQTHESKTPKLPGLVAPLWVPDDYVDTCAHCSAPFTLIWRRHHCRSCGRIFCSVCCNQLARLAYMQYQRIVRVCEPCAKQIKQILKENSKRKPDYNRNIPAFQGVPPCYSNTVTPRRRTSSATQTNPPTSQARAAALTPAHNNVEFRCMVTSQELPGRSEASTHGNSMISTQGLPGRREDPAHGNSMISSQGLPGRSEDPTHWDSMISTQGLPGRREDPAHGNSMISTQGLPGRREDPAHDGNSMISTQGLPPGRNEDPTHGNSMISTQGLPGRREDPAHGNSMISTQGLPGRREDPAHDGNSMISTQGLPGRSEDPAYGNSMISTQGLPGRREDPSHGDGMISTQGLPGRSEDPSHGDTMISTQGPPGRSEDPSHGDSMTATQGLPGRREHPTHGNSMTATQGLPGRREVKVQNDALPSVDQQESRENASITNQAHTFPEQIQSLQSQAQGIVLDTSSVPVTRSGHYQHPQFSLQPSQSLPGIPAHGQPQAPNGDTPRIANLDGNTNSRAQPQGSNVGNSSAPGTGSGNYQQPQIYAFQPSQLLPGTPTSMQPQVSNSVTPSTENLQGAYVNNSSASAVTYTGSGKYQQPQIYTFQPSQLLPGTPTSVQSQVSNSDTPATAQLQETYVSNSSASGEGSGNYQQPHIYALQPGQSLPGKPTSMQSQVSNSVTPGTAQLQGVYVHVSTAPGSGNYQQPQIYALQPGQSLPGKPTSVQPQVLNSDTPATAQLQGAYVNNSSASGEGSGNYQQPQIYALQPSNPLPGKPTSVQPQVSNSVTPATAQLQGAYVNVSTAPGSGNYQQPQIYALQPGQSLPGTPTSVKTQSVSHSAIPATAQIQGAIVNVSSAPGSGSASGTGSGNSQQPPIYSLQPAYALNNQGQYVLVPTLPNLQPRSVMFTNPGQVVQAEPMVYNAGLQQ